MRIRLLSALFVLVLAASAPISAQAFQPSEPTIPVDQIHAGMRGVGRTIFAGDKPEEFGVEVLGVLRDTAGPRSSVILVRLHGQNAERYGVAGGMSGSPVYFDGKLAGAVAYRFGEFSKEPIAGVTPIADMLEVAAAASPAPAPELARLLSGEAVATPSSVDASSPQRIETPLVAAGFSAEALRRLQPMFAAQGLRVVAGGAAAADEKPEPFVSGGAVGLALLRGDLSMAAICTVTYVDAERLLACGHPVFGAGKVEFPMTNARIIATLPTALSPSKIGVIGATVGSFVQDRRHAIYGRLDRTPRMIPITAQIGDDATRAIRLEAIDDPRFTPSIVASALLGAVIDDNAFRAGDSLRVNIELRLKGHAPLALHDFLSSGEIGQEAVMALAGGLYEKIARLYANSGDAPGLESLSLRLEPLHGRRSLRVEAARAELDSVRPGETLPVDVTLLSPRGESIVRRVLFRIPEGAPAGPARLLVGAGAPLDRPRMASLEAGGADLEQTLQAYAAQRPNDRLTLALIAPSPQILANGASIGNLPATLAAVYAPQRATRELMILNESPIAEQGETLDAQLLGSILVPVVIE